MEIVKNLLVGNEMGNCRSKYGTKVGNGRGQESSNPWICIHTDNLYQLNMSLADPSSLFILISLAFWLGLVFEIRIITSLLLYR